MSLLLDALRRAEEARRAKEADSSNALPPDDTAAARKGTRIEPTIASPVPELALEDPTTFDKPEKLPATKLNTMVPATTARSGLALEEIADQAPVADIAPEPAPLLISATARAANTAVANAPKELTPREMARNVFSAKQAGTDLPSENRGKRRWILPFIAVALAIGGAGGWYVWNEVNRVSSPLIARTSSPPPAVLPKAASNTGQPGSKPTPTGEQIAVKVEEVILPPLLPPPATELAAPKMPALPKLVGERTLTARELLANKLRDAPAVKEVPTGLKLARSSEAPRLNPDLANAYRLLVSGDYAGARTLYAGLVQAEPLNVDAHLGLATAAARAGDRSAAIQHYRQVLALDPRNGLATMGLVALNEGVPSAALEIELRTLIGRNPDAAPLQFALGNIFAGQERWTEAQQAYFEAFRIDPVNPDYLFNLAVSLDQLRQPKLALDYYRKAEGVAMAKGGGQFDRNTIAKRIRELSGETGRNN